MIASTLADDAYALVIDDDTDDKNGYYQKRASNWFYLKYNPLTSAVSVLDKSDIKNAQSGLSISNYLENINIEPENPTEILENIRLSKYSGIDDPTLIKGYVNDMGMLVPNESHRSAEFLIPSTAKHLKGFSLKTPVFFAIINKSNQLEVAGYTDLTEDVELPLLSYKLVITVGFDNPLENQDFTTNYIVFSKPYIQRYRNHVLRNSDVALNIEKPIVTSSEFLFIALPSYDTAVTLTASSNAKIPEVFFGRVNSDGIVENFVGGFVAKIPIPDGAKSYDVELSSYLYVSVLNNNMVSLKVSTSAERNVRLPDNAAFLIVGLKQKCFEAEVLKDKVIFYYDNREYVLNDTLGKNLIKEVHANDAGKIMLAKNQYTIEGFDFRLYTSSLFSGYQPMINFSVEVTGTGVVRDRGGFVIVLAAGIAKVSVYNDHRTLIDEKTTTIRSKPMPTQINAVFSASDPLQVLFIGDSLIWNNNNLIGKEWLRMLNTEQNNQTIVDGIIYPPTFNLGEGNIQLVGTKSTADRKYEVGNLLSYMMVSEPFYNIASTEPDIIDSDGWNKRVDLVNYFQSVCGVGKYPRYIYLASGVNDIVELGWDINSLPLVRNMMKSVLGRMKQACDTIAGGNSDVQILLMNHQFYPFDKGQYQDYSPQRQRNIWAEHYEQYEKMIDEQSVNGKRLNTYVRFVDCASSFDIDHGYSYEQARVNPRNTQLRDLVIDTVHMGEGGACMYADALLRDFLYHECS